MSSELKLYRQQLRLDQEAVLNAIASKRAPIFKEIDLSVAADAVVRKRAWCVASAWPLAAHSLGPNFLDLFREYVLVEPFPSPGGSLADGRKFLGFVSKRALTTDFSIVETFAFDLQHNLNSDGFFCKSRFRLLVRRLRSRRLWLVGIFVPRIGMAAISIPFKYRMLKRAEADRSGSQMR